MVLKSHPHEHLQLGWELPLPLGIALVRDAGSLEEDTEHVTTQLSAAVLFRGEHDLVGGDPVVGHSSVTAQHPDYHVRDAVLGLKGTEKVINCNY